MISLIKQLGARLGWRGSILLVLVLTPILGYMAVVAALLVTFGHRQFVDWNGEAQQLRSIEYIHSKKIFYQTPQAARNARYYWARDLSGVPFEFLTFEIEEAQWDASLAHFECRDTFFKDQFSFDFLPAVDWWPTGARGKGEVTHCQTAWLDEYEIYTETQRGTTTVWVQGYYSLW